MAASSAARRVLVVEDEYLIRMLLEDMLDELGYGVAALHCRSHSRPSNSRPRSRG